MTLPEVLAELLDPAWYLASYPDVRSLGTDPVAHFINHGLEDGRNPNAWFHRAWYETNYPDPAALGLIPLLHYIRIGAAALFNPHPRFDAAWYVRQHPEAAANPLLHHIQVGQALGWATEPVAAIADYLPSAARALCRPPGLFVDVVIPVYRGLAWVQQCVHQVLADRDRPPGRIIVVDDHSPEPALSAWIDDLAAARRIKRLRNRQHRGFLASSNRGIAAAGTHDVVLLESGTNLPFGAIGRLAAHAWSEPRIASVCPFGGGGTIQDGSPTAGRATSGGLDAICQQVNIARSVEVPTTDGVCMYLRRDALLDAGPLDEASSGRDAIGRYRDREYRDGQIHFCRRSAARGWRHLLACDTFIARFDDPSDEGQAGATSFSGSTLLAPRASADVVGPFHFAVTAGAFRHSGKPTILMIIHGLGGGAHRQMMALVDRLVGQANFLLLFATIRGVALTAPAFPDHPLFCAAPDRLDDLVRLLQSFPVARAHIHHLKGLEYDVRGLIHRLGVPFDVTVHDYFAICPQVNLLPWPDQPYCGEPGPAGCNACIASRPADGATEILAWRRERAWQFLEAERVFCPSEDVHNRLTRYGLASRALVVPHEPVGRGPWPLKVPVLRGRRLRIVLLGVVAYLKGAVAVAGLVELAERAGLEIHVIGSLEAGFPAAARHLIHVTGTYQEADLPRLLAEVQPHVAWFPSPCPETYSYTLTAAIKAGLPIVATAIGSYPERLAGRPMTWVVDPLLPAPGWLEVFAKVRDALRQPRPAVSIPDRPPIEDYYTGHYLAPPDLVPLRVATSAGRRPRRLSDLRHPGRTSVVVVPERMDSGVPSPAAYLRLLQPIDHLAQGLPIDMVLADAETALQCHADVILSHRHAVPDRALADRLGRHARATGAVLVYDLDEDLLAVPRDNADAPRSRANASVVRRMLLHADHVLVATETLAAALAVAGVSGPAVVIPDGLDERLWCDQPRPPPSHAGVVRILLMGPDIDDADLGLILPALLRIKQEYGGWVTVDAVGLAPTTAPPPWVQVRAAAVASYPGFVHWVTSQPGWDIGLAPQGDTPCKRSRSGMKVLDYAALGMAVLASDAPAFRGSLADGPGGMLVGRGPQAWYAAINWLIRNPGLRGDLAAEARRRFLAGGTLAAQTAHRRAAWETVAQPWTKGATGMAQPASGRRAGANQPRARWRRKASVEV